MQWPPTSRKSGSNAPHRPIPSSRRRAARSCAAREETPPRFIASAAANARSCRRGRSGVSMIVLFTDFGLHGPYTGQMKAVLHWMAPGLPTVDLFADAPAGNAKASAYLLPAYAPWFAAGARCLLVGAPR